MVDLVIQKPVKHGAQVHLSLACDSLEPDGCGQVCVGQPTNEIGPPVLQTLKLGHKILILTPRCHDPLTSDTEVPTLEPSSRQLEKHVVGS